MDPTISVGGRSFPIPPLTARRIKAYIPRMLKFPTDLTAVTEAQIDNLYEALLLGIQQGMPAMTLDELLDMPIPLNELVAALMIISAQAGMKDAAAGPPAEAASPGPSTSPPLKTNGTSASPT